MFIAPTKTLICVVCYLYWPTRFKK